MRTAPRKKATKKAAAKKAAARKAVAKKAAPKPAKKAAAVVPPPPDPAPSYTAPERALDAWARLDAKEQEFIARFMATGDAAVAKMAVFGKAGSLDKLLERKSVRGFMRAVNETVVTQIIADKAWITERLVLEATTAPESASRVKSLTELGKLGDFYPSKLVKHAMDPALKSLMDQLDALDGVDTGLTGTT